VPRTRLAHAELGNEHVHLGVELDQDALGIVMVGCQVVTRRMAGRPPERRRSGMGQLVAGGRMSRAVFQLEGDVMNPRLRDMHKIDDVVIAVAGQKRRDALEFVRVPKAKEVLVKPPQFVSLGLITATCPRRNGATPPSLKPGAGESICE